jgi:hypothetical protein
MKILQNRPAAFLGAVLCMLGLSACSGSMQRNKPEQGLQGAFSTYTRSVQKDCSKLAMQVERDTCRRQNERIVDEPFVGTIEIRNLTTDEKTSVTLDSQGNYRVLLNAGQYEVCVAAFCSDPIEIRMGAFPIYGQRLPKAEVDTTQSIKPVGENQASDPK